MKKNLHILFAFIALVCCKNTSAQQWKIYADSASTSEQKRDFQKAVLYHELSLQQLPADSSQTMLHADIFRKLGENKLRLSQYQDAENFLLRSYEIVYRNTDGNNSLAAIVNDRLARVYTAIHPRKAAAYYIRSRNINQFIYSDSSLQYAAACNNLANYYTSISDYREAETLHHIAKTIRRKLLGSNDPEYARSCNNLAYVYYRTGQHQEAEELALEALRIRAALPPAKANPDYAITCINLANIYTSLGQYSKAEKLYAEAKIIRSSLQPLGQHADYAATCNILADFYAGTDRFREAEKLYLEAMTIREKNTGIFSVDYAESCNNLSSLYSNIGRQQESIQLALQAKQIWDSVAPANSPDQAINRNNLGDLYDRQAAYPQALDYLLQARKIWSQHFSADHFYLLTNAGSIAAVYSSMKNDDTAALYYEEALAGYRQQVEKVFSFSTESEKQDFIRNIKGFTDEYIAFCARRMDKNSAGKIYDLSTLYRNIIFSSSAGLNRIVANSHDSLLKNNYDDWTRLKKLLAYQHSAPQNTDTATMLLTLEKADEKEKWMTARSASFAQKRTIAGWKTIREKLTANEAAVEFVKYNYYSSRGATDSSRYAALVLTNNAAEPVLIPLCSQQVLDSLLHKDSVNSYQPSLYTRGTKGLKLLKQTRQLYELLWKPLEQSLHGAETIYFAVSGDLHEISFAAIPVNDQMTVSDRYNLVQLNNTAAVANREEKLIDKKDVLLLYGGIQYSHNSNKPAVGEKEQYDFLPGTLEEVKEIKKLAVHHQYKVITKTGMAATEESLASSATRLNPAILHIATHGFYKKDSTQNHDRRRAYSHPLFRSGLLMAGAMDKPNENGNAKEDGIATAYEISNLVMPGIKLVTLSACETALGDIEGNEGVFGLQRAFKLAGAEYLLMSLWEVPDRETAIFMKLFYASLFKTRRVHSAFSDARQQMKKLFPGKPAAWAAWVLIQ